MSNARKRATKLEDNSPEARERRARAEEDARALAEHQRREAEIEAMSPEERIAARLVERAGGEVYRPAFEFMVKSALDNGGVLKGPEVAHRAAKVLRNSRTVLLGRLQDEEDRKAGLSGHAPTGRMSKPLTKKDVQALVVKRYASHRKTNQSAWWKRYIEDAGIIARKAHYRGYSVDLGQLAASLSKLTEADIAPHLAA